MRQDIRPVLAIAGLITASLALASCGHHQMPMAANRPAPGTAVFIAPMRPALAPIPGSAVWNLRTGLNVAAQSCRGRERQPVAGAYLQVLNRHRTLLAAAHRQEQGRYGAAAFDRQQARVYSTFANQASAPYFCEVAKAVALRASGLDSQALMAEAPHLVEHLQVALQLPPQRIAIRSR